jgi:hypothetical protein
MHEISRLLNTNACIQHDFGTLTQPRKPGSLYLRGLRLYLVLRGCLELYFGGKGYSVTLLTKRSIHYFGYNCMAKCLFDPMHYPCTRRNSYAV